MSISANQAERFTDQLSATEQRALVMWIQRNLSPWRGGQRRMLNSYYLKHVAEGDLGFYITNGAFKGAMIEAGWEPVNRSAMNWDYRVRLDRQEAA